MAIRHQYARQHPIETPAVLGIIRQAYKRSGGRWGIGLSAIAAELQRQPSSVQRHVNKLLAAGLIETHTGYKSHKRYVPKEQPV